jgi:hypothetical protein
MKRKVTIATACAAAAGLVSACGGGNHNSPPVTPPASSPPPTSSNQMLDTAQVLALAKQTSEMSLPIAVNGGALMLTDTSETSEPISVD